jgi:hypothetical protein
MRTFPAAPSAFSPERLQQRRQRAPLQGPIDDDAHGSGPIVPHEHDNGLVEARVAHAGRSDEELTGERGALRQRRGRRQRRGQEQRHDRRGDDAKTIKAVQGHTSSLRGPTHAIIEAKRAARKWSTSRPMQPLYTRHAESALPAIELCVRERVSLHRRRWRAGQQERPKVPS